MIASAQTLARLLPVLPFVQRGVFNGMSFGLGPAGYDIRIAETIWLHPLRSFRLASTIEHFAMHDNLLGVVHDKSSWARRGVTVQNTIIEPGWRGFLTLELTSHCWRPIRIPAGAPIAQVVFHLLDQPTDRAYSGKYQDQEPGPQPARVERAPR